LALGADRQSSPSQFSKFFLQRQEYDDSVPIVGSVVQETQSAGPDQEGNKSLAD